MATAIMMTSLCFPSSWYSVPSCDGRFIASIDKHCLIIRSATKNHILHTFNLPQSSTSQWRFLRWFRSDGMSNDQRGCHQQLNHVLVANDDVVLVWDAEDAKWHAEINGAANNLGKLSNVQFGFSANEILIFSAFGVKLTIWSLLNCRGVEIRDPKNLLSCYDYRPRTGHLAVLIRDAAHDALHLLTPGNHELVTNAELTTVDAQGLKWSPDGQWIAIWDAASYGYKILIFTADGHLYKSYFGGQDNENIGLGIMTVNWSPSGNFLAIGDFNQSAILLNNNMFSPVITFDHPNTINFPQSPIWQEQINASGERSYCISPQPTCPPTKDSGADSPSGISILEYNKSGTFLATKSDLNPTTIWIWHLKTVSAAAVLIHHSPVDKVEWHPLIADLLLIHCNVDKPVIHLWRDSWDCPKIFNLNFDRKSRKTEASWLSESDDLLSFMLTNLHNYATGQITNNGELISVAGIAGAGLAPEEMFDEGNSLDLSPLKSFQDETTNELRDNSPGNGRLDQRAVSDEADDTFEYRRQRKASV